MSCMICGRECSLAVWHIDNVDQKPRGVCHTCVSPVRGATAGNTKAVLTSIAFERERQKTSEGWTEEHDDAHESGEMGMAAACYAAPERILVNRYPLPGDAWPWPKEWINAPSTTAGGNW